MTKQKEQERPETRATAAGRSEFALLCVGDIVTVHNPLLSSEHSKYPVTRLDGNKAVTKFRDFNRKIYNGKYVYEFGKRINPTYSNTYTVNDT